MPKDMIHNIAQSVNLEVEMTFKINTNARSPRRIDLNDDEYCSGRHGHAFYRA